MQIPNMILTTFLKRSSYKNSFEATFTRKKNQKKKKKNHINYSLIWKEEYIMTYNFCSKNV